METFEELAKNKTKIAKNDPIKRGKNAFLNSVIGIILKQWRGRNAFFNQSRGKNTLFIML